MTVTQAASLLEISRATAYQLCREGKLAHHRVGSKGGVIRITAADVAAYQAAHRVEASEPGVPTRTPRPQVGHGDVKARVLAKWHALKAAKKA